MDTGIAASDYTKTLAVEVESVKADEKVRLKYMTLYDKMVEERRMGGYETIVSLIRRKLQQFSIEELADLFGISQEECESTARCITAHPDWDDEQVAEEIDWED